MMSNLVIYYSLFVYLYTIYILHNLYILALYFHLKFLIKVVTYGRGDL